MRYYIEEVAEYEWDDMKKYILSIKGFSVESLLDEIIHNIQNTKPHLTCAHEEDWIKEYKDNFRDSSIETLMVYAVEYKYYLYGTEEEQEWNMNVINKVINGEEWRDRFTGRIMK